MVLNLYNSHEYSIQNFHLIICIKIISDFLEKEMINQSQVFFDVSFD